MEPEERLKFLDIEIRDGKLPSWDKFGQSAKNLGELVWNANRTFESDVKEIKGRLRNRYPNIIGNHLVFDKRKGGYKYHKDVSGLTDLSRLEIDQLATLSNDLLLTNKNLMISDTARNLLERLNTIAKVHDFDKQRISNNWDPVEFILEGRREGQQHVDGLIKAISDLRIIKLKYGSYENPVSERLVLPLLLKEWDNAWYLLVRPLENQLDSIHIKMQDLKLFALNRIQSFTVEDCMRSKIINLKTFQPSKYFSNIYGVTSYNLSDDKGADKIHRIVLETSDSWHYGYLLNDPIHTTKKILKNDTERKYIKVQINCQLNHEIMNLLLGFTPQIRVLSPIKVIEEIKTRAKEIYEAYP